ncbi:hypothetical protein QQZ08_010965 [Neonectria magnoliae]|uniref:NAD-dependent epimerase/dehydratase domain-containing protein n=1 Tax=Neonectria magnoliae TaxID=2732573 RepID=A0ABR1HE20_9HYPO
MGSLDSLAIPKGSTVLVTGANGLVGSHIADQFLTYGYKVHGTVRNPEKTSWLADVFDKNHGKGAFELFKVPDMTTEGAFDEAVKGVSTVAHSASVMSLDFNPHNVIPIAVAGAINALKAAAAVTSTLGVPGMAVTEEIWNEDAVKEAWAEPPYTPERILAVYAASKTQAEQEVWKYHQEHRSERPDLVVNTGKSSSWMLPNVNFGKSVDPVHQGFPSSAGIPALLWKGEVTDIHHLMPPQYFIDAQDTGRLHVAAGILERVQGQRILGFAQRFSWDSLLEAMRGIEPGRKFPENFSGGEDPNEILPRDKAEQLLRDLGRQGWTSLEESIRGLVEGLHVAEKAATARGN